MKLIDTKGLIET